MIHVNSLLYIFIWLAPLCNVEDRNFEAARMPSIENIQLPLFVTQQHNVYSGCDVLSTTCSHALHIIYTAAVTYLNTTCSNALHIIYTAAVTYLNTTCGNTLHSIYTAAVTYLNTACSKALHIIYTAAVMYLNTTCSNTLHYYVKLYILCLHDLVS